jgi:uncharacterized protein (DUF58 family)
VLCVLDTGRTSAGRIASRAAVDATPDAATFAGEPRLDLAIDAALLLTTLAAHAGDRVDLLAIDTQTHANISAASKRALPRVQAALAPLVPALVETDFGRVAAEVLALERKRALVVLFTTLDPGALGEGLLPVLPSLVSRHTVVVAAVHDPALGRTPPAGAPPRRCTSRPPPSGAWPSSRRVPGRADPLRVQVIDARPSRSRPQWPTRTSPSKAAAGSRPRTRFKR